MYFESHITFERTDGERVDRMARDVFPDRWKYSQIDGDPVLGKKVFCYLTAHDKDGDLLKRRMDVVIDYARTNGIGPVRAKIEQIIYDERF